VRSEGLSTLGKVSGDSQNFVVGDTEEVDALPVLAQEATVLSDPFAGELSRSRGSAAIPVVQAAAVAAGGFVAGAAVVRLVTRRQRHSAALTKGRRAGRRLGRAGRGRGGASGASELVQIVGSRSLLVDVHLLGGRD
jgi:hypothetical protein